MTATEESGTCESSDPVVLRQRLATTLDALEEIAADRRDSVLLMTTAALKAVNGLYPGAEALRLRGTPDQAAQMAIHNTIIDVLVRYADMDEFPWDNVLES